MIAIISPAKSLDISRKSPLNLDSQVYFPQEADLIMAKLKKLKPNKIAELMGLSADLANLNFQRYQDWTTASQPVSAFQAMFGFNGEVYRGLDAASMKSKEINFAQDHLRILSGLYGMLRPLDLISPYRLEMGTSLPISAKHKNLYSFWTEKVTETLHQELQGKPLINLASQEYFKVINFKKIQSEVITPSFLDAKGGDYKSIQVYTKKARGLMARFIIDHKLKKINDLLAFNIEGYAFNDRLSKENNWVFTRG